MIKNYGLYYSFSKDKDTLEVLISNDNFSRVENHESVDLFYKNDELVKFNVYGIKKYVKIRINGLIYFPSQELISLINGYIGEFGIMLANKNDSGFYIEKINEKYAVIAKKGTFLPDYELVSEDRICTFKDLSISDSTSELFIEEGLTDKDIGKDFFAMEEHENVGD